MTATLAVDARCEVRTADRDEQVFFARAAVEAGFDVDPGSEPACGCAADGGTPTVEVRVALRHGCVAGFYQFAVCGCAAERATLDYLYVHHGVRRTGVGRALVDDLRRQVAERQLGAVRVVAHPAAESFFHRVGAQRLGTVIRSGAVPWARPEFRVVAPVPTPDRRPRLTDGPT